MSSGTETSAPPAPARTARSAAPRSRGVMRRFVLPFVIPVIVIAVWEYVGRAQLLADGLFPPASTCVMALLDWVFGWRVSGSFTPSQVYSGTWLLHMGSSVFRILIGYGIIHTGCHCQLIFYRDEVFFCQRLRCPAGAYIF